MSQAASSLKSLKFKIKMLGSRPRARSAFPTKVPSYLGVHKSVLENKIQSKRERESDNGLEWQVSFLKVSIAHSASISFFIAIYFNQKMIFRVLRNTYQKLT